jgi:hypothetical protein
LDLRFADNKTLRDSASGSELVTFTRASSGTYAGSDGLIKTATTNLLLRSEEFDNASWSKFLCTITQNSIAAPDGQVTADLLVEDTTNGFRALQQSFTAVASTAYAFSVYIKAGDRTFARVYAGTSASWTSAPSAIFNLSTGAVQSGSNASIAAVGNGWYRCTVTGTFGATGGATAFLVGPVLTSGGTNSYLGTGANAIYIWGAQLEQSSTMGEYIPTTSTINSAPRFDHNPTTGESLGLLVEEQRTNLAFPSNMPTSAAQTLTGNMQANGATQITSGVPAPDSSTNGFTVSGASATTNSSGSNNVRILSVMAAAGTHTVSMWIKTNSSSTTVTIRDATTSTGIGFVTTSSWTRITATFNNTSAGNIILLSTSGTAFDCFGVQVESGPFPTSYIPTTTATVTRSADVAGISGSNFSSWYRQDEGTVFAEYQPSKVVNSTIWDISSATNENYNLRYASMSQLQSAGSVNGITQWNIAPAGYSTTGLSYKVALGIKVNDIAQSAQGTITSSDNLASIPSANEIDIGQSRLGGDFGVFTIRRLTYWPQRLSNSTLQAVTQ